MTAAPYRCDKCGMATFAGHPDGCPPAHPLPFAGGVNELALVELVRAAMAAGAAYFAERARDGLVSTTDSLADAFGEFPSEFIRIRFHLVKALSAEDVD